MGMLRLVSPPAIEPVAVTEARSQLGLPDSVPDVTISAALSSSRQVFDGGDGYLRRALISQTWELTLHGSPLGAFRLPVPNVQRILSVETLTNGAWVEAPQDGYRLSLGPPDLAVPVTRWPAAHGLRSFRVRYVTGYGDASKDVPEAIRAAIILHARPIITAMMIDPGLQSETVDGLGTIRWGLSADAAGNYSSAAARLVAKYRMLADDA